jgi:hypothetical protein
MGDNPEILIFKQHDNYLPFLKLARKFLILLQVN